MVKEGNCSVIFIKLAPIQTQQHTIASGDYLQSKVTKLKHKQTVTSYHEIIKVAVVKSIVSVLAIQGSRVHVFIILYQTTILLVGL